MPGLGELMSGNQMRHLKLWFAGEGQSWRLADYELDELEEGFADVVSFHPGPHKQSAGRLDGLVPEFMSGPIAALRAAIEAQNRADFESAYDTLTLSCNACHAATDFGFNVVQRPTVNPFGNQAFEPLP